MKRLYVVPSLAVVAMVALGGVALRGNALGAAPHHASGPSSIRPTSFYEASVVCCTDFRELVAQSDVVVRARVVKTLPSYVIPNLPAVPVIANSSHLTGPKATAIAQATPANAGDTLPPAANEGLVKTDSAVVVLGVLKGNTVQSGQQLTVAQLGGIDPQGNAVQLMGDPLLVSGGEEVLFLKYSPITGKYATVGDSQGRFAIDPSGTVRALGAADFRYTAAYSGETVDGLAAAIRAVE